MRALKTFIFSLKGQGVSLKGMFSLKNLVWIPRTKQIKLRKVKEEDFVKFKIEYGERDCRAVAEALEELMGGYGIPNDLANWLSLLKHGSPYSKSYLVKNHVALMDANEKLHHMIYLYAQLDQLKRRMEKLKERKGDKDVGYLRAEKKFSAVCSGVPSGETESGHDWRGDLHDNEYLKKIFDHNSYQYYGGNSTYQLVSFARHSSQHLIDHSVTKQGEILFKYEHMVAMICYAYPNLFYEFQSAMFNQGYQDPNYRARN